MHGFSRGLFVDSLHDVTRSCFGCQAGARGTILRVRLPIWTPRTFREASWALPTGPQISRKTRRRRGHFGASLSPRAPAFRAGPAAPRGAQRPPEAPERPPTGTQRPQKPGAAGSAPCGTRSVRGVSQTIRGERCANPPSGAVRGTLNGARSV